ncbi:MAG: ribonuclease P protein component [Bacteroidales bacterium]|nr:ribonuclease P protein component [Bacteroidales bacterium]
MRAEGQTFSKEERLKSRKLINNLFDCGKIIHHHPFKVLYQVTKNENNNFPAKIAISVSKKNFKRAVDRNYIKRKIKETYRQNKQSLYKELDKINRKLYFFVIYTAKHDIDYLTLNSEMKLLIQKLNDKLNQF